jgi:hypothetical protein
MRTLSCLVALCAAAVCAEQSLPPTEGETLAGKKVTLPAATGGQPALLIIGFTHGSQTQTKAWADRAAHDRLPAWSVAVLEDVPRLVRGMATHGIRGGTPKDRFDRFVLVFHGEKALKQAVGFDRPDDAYLVVVDGAGMIRHTYHGPVTDAEVEQIGAQLKGTGGG